MFDLLKLYSLYKAVAPALIALAGGVLAVQDAMGVTHSTIVGSIAVGLLSLLGAHAAAAAHKANAAPAGVDKEDVSQNPPT
jgi:hypothetical protein